MTYELTPLMKVGIAFAYLGGLSFFVAGVALSVRRRRIHPLLLVSIAAISICWIEAPYDWVTYAQFSPAMPRMPSWWPLNKTYGGLPAPVPLGYIAYFILPAAIGAFVGRRLSARTGWRRPQTLLATGLVVGVVWALFFNAFVGARLGLFYYGRVIPGLALWEGTKHQYPLYDAVAMGVQAMTFAYILGRTDDAGRTFIERWADSRARTSLQSAGLSILGVVVIAHAVYASVFAPHLITKLRGDVTAGPTEQFFEGVPNQPLHG